MPGRERARAGLADRQVRARAARVQSRGRPLGEQRIERGLIRIATVTLLEVGYSARTAADLLSGLRDPPVGAMPVEHATPLAEGRAVEVLTRLAERGHHHAPSIPDLIVAALAESANLVVLHDDKDFELIAALTGQPVERLAC